MPHRSAESPEAPGLSEERAQSLEALGYFERSLAANPEERNVTKKTPDAASGLNLYSSRHAAKAYLVDMKGEVLHTWEGKDERPGWMHIEMLPTGDLLAIADFIYLMKLNWDSEVVWRASVAAHHDLDIDDEGRIFVLTYRVKQYSYDGTAIPIKDIKITILSPEGRLLREHRLFPVLRHLVPKTRLARIKRCLASGSSVRSLVQEDAPADVLHANSIEILEKPIPSISPVGAILISFRELNRIVVLNPEMTEALWVWGKGELEEQHHATLLENAHIMVFDNGARRKQSRVLEIDPTTKSVVWSYTTPGFYTRLRGAAQKLEGGNVLVTESDRGHAFEITEGGEKVWEFWNPDVVGSRNPKRAVIYRMTRYDRRYLKEGLIKALPPPGEGG